MVLGDGPHLVCAGRQGRQRHRQLHVCVPGPAERRADAQLRAAGGRFAVAVDDMRQRGGREAAARGAGACGCAAVGAVSARGHGSEV